jgi:hypothetical protein
MTCSMGASAPQGRTCLSSAHTQEAGTAATLPLALALPSPPLAPQAESSK